MSNFNFISQVCTSLEQSERLLALGLKRETADMYATNMSSKGINYTDDWKIGSIPYCNAISFLNSQGLQLEKTAWSIIPAWSLHRLIEMVPNKISVFNSSASLIVSNEKVQYYLHDVEYSDYLTGAGCWKSGNIYDNIIDCIGWLIIEGYFNKGYLEE